MRYILIILIFVSSIIANDSIVYFKENKENKVFCHIGQYSYKMLTQNEANIVHVNGHDYFKMKNENLYFLSNSCQPLKARKELLGF
ncbi:MAG: hypothetical protein DRG78_18490 [Epsilonproteobacteria bacterium]|nr:MAG: hypothetical protein DRG78_18490 [Campylobacterota bacterium]